MARETVELAFLAALQHLPPRQRAVLVLRDLIDWPARDTAELLETTEASVNSALQRAHATLARHLPARRAEWADPDRRRASERSLLQRLMEAWERADAGALAALLHEDARMAMPPTPSWYDGRAAIHAFFAGHAFGDSTPGEMRALPTAANGQPAVGVYVRSPGTDDFRPFALAVLDVDGDAIAELAFFRLPELFPRCGLPSTLER